MKNLRVTPLNLGMAALLTWMIWEFPGAGGQGIFSLRVLLILLLVLALLLADQVFRHYIRDIRRLWLIEGAFLLLVLALAWIVGAI